MTHRFEFARPWARERFGALLDDFLSTLRIDLEGMQARLSTLDTSDPEALQQAFESDEGLFGAELDDEQRLKLARIQAFMSAAEGYGDHVMHALGSELLPSYGRIEEAMRRYREGEAGDPVFERLLGVEMKREQYEVGPRVLRHGRRAHRRGHPRAHVGVPRRDAVTAGSRRAPTLARPHRLIAGRGGPVGYPLRSMEPVGELVAAAVVDERVWNAYGAEANDGVYLVGQPGPALPFMIFRAWKVPVGFVSEEVRLIGPSGRTLYPVGTRAAAHGRRDGRHDRARPRRRTRSSTRPAPTWPRSSSTT